MKARPAWIVLSALCVPFALAGAAARAEDEGAASVNVGGEELSCTDYLGRQVRTCTIAGLGDEREDVVAFGRATSPIAADLP